MCLLQHAKIFTVRKEVAKVMFLQVCVCPQGWWWYPSMPCSRSLGGGCVLSQHALQVASQHALQQVSRGVLGLGGIWSWGGAWSGGSAPGGVPGLGGLVSQHALRQTPPWRDSYCCRHCASHWNAFLSRKHSSRMHATHFETVRASQGKGLGHQV